MSTLTQERFDVVKAEAFTGRLLGALNEAALTLMVSIGHRTRLFDVLAERGSSTSAELAQAAGLDERYVREWLGAMAVGGVVDYDPVARRYALPAEHASVLTRGAAVNLAASAQFVPVLASVEDQVVDCFANGGGVPYDAYPRFHEVMAEESDQTVVAALEAHILPLAPGLTEALRDGIDVLDVGCGRGRALAKLAATYPASRFVGYDLSPAAIAEGNARAASAGLRNLRLEVRDVAALEDEARFDLVTAFDAIHDQARPDRVLERIHASLKPLGLLLMQDIGASRDVEKNFAHVLGPWLYTISCMHCMTVSLAQGGAGL
ncbi:MAG TPA: class I SAM-dependent methyltransferase, partial [Vicinamibacteria bacterium]|nr:class I SAM-dependent methyltransferase [Vicinamibacteria bacterium]